MQAKSLRRKKGSMQAKSLPCKESPLRGRGFLREKNSSRGVSLHEKRFSRVKGLPRGKGSPGEMGFSA